MKKQTSKQKLRKQIGAFITDITEGYADSCHMDPRKAEVDVLEALAEVTGSNKKSKKLPWSGFISKLALHMTFRAHKQQKNQWAFSR